MKNTQQEIDRAVRAAARAIDEARHLGSNTRAVEHHARDAFGMYGVEPNDFLVSQAFRRANAMYPPRTPKKRPMSSFAPRRPAAR